MTATNRAAPMIDHRTGKGWPLMLTVRGSGSLSWTASHGPTTAPMKPRTMDTMSPPRMSPAMALPMAPQTAAMTMSRMSPGTVNVMTDTSFRPDRPSHRSHTPGANREVHHRYRLVVPPDVLRGAFF